MRSPAVSSELERGVLASLFYASRDDRDAALARLHPIDFSDIRYRIIYEAFSECVSERGDADESLVIGQLTREGKLETVGGASAVAEIDTGETRPDLLPYHVDQLIELALKRRLHAVAGGVAQAASNGSQVADLVGRLDAEVTAVKARLTGASGGNRIRAVTVEELFELQVPKRRFIIEPWLREKDLVLIYSWRGIGKTHLGLSLAAAIASGGQVIHGWRVTEPRNVLLIDGEMPADELRKRFAGWCASMPELTKTLRIVAADLQERGLPDLATPDGQMAIEPYLDDIDVVLMDNFSTLCRGTLTENEAESWLPIQAWLLDLRRRGMTALGYHHAGKGGQQRGTSKREDVLDTVIALRRPGNYKSTDGCCFELHFEKSRGLRGDVTEPLELMLNDADGQLSWMSKPVEQSTGEKCVSLRNEGLSHLEIAQELGITKSVVTRHLKRRGVS
jgi:hypothetical protein